MDEYILFVDETLKTTINPYFCLAGVCVKRNYYEDIVTKEINSLKNRHFASTDVILHYSDINNKKGVFSIFKDGEKRNLFWNDYFTIVKKLDFVTFGIYFDQSIMSGLYKTKDISLYDIAFCELLKNYICFLKEVNGIGSICMESRSSKENFYLQTTYYNLLKNGSEYFVSKDMQKHLSSIGFIVKGDNCIGLQIADVAPSALLRKINSKKDSYKIGELYTNKLYGKVKNMENVIGLRKIL